VLLIMFGGCRFVFFVLEFGGSGRSTREVWLCCGVVIVMGVCDGCV